MKSQKYWIIKEQNRGVGRYPQVSGWLPPYDPWQKNSIWGGGYDYWGKIDPKINFPQFIIHPDAILTDIIGSNSFKSGTTLLCSNKAAELFSLFKMPDFQLFKVKLAYRGADVTYNLIYFCEINNNYIDYEKSQFYVKEAGVKKDIFIKSEVEYNEERNRMCELTNIARIRAQKLHFTKNIPTDIFRVYDSEVALIVNDSMKSVIEKELSGVRFILL